MAQYIPKDAVVAEIIKRRAERVEQIKIGDDKTRPIDGAVSVEHTSLLHFLDTLEVKEVDSDDAVSATIDFPLIGYDFPNIYPNYKELKEYCIRHCIKDNDKVKITIVKEK